MPSTLAARLLAMADDELILAHRNSEWTGHAPILEEDIAIANIAQDELGHAQIWYALHAIETGADPETHADRQVFARPAAEWRNAPMLEWPRGDWAFTLLRQYLFDQYEHVLLKALASSSHTGIAQAAAKIAREERYHLLHSEAWVKRLALGTEESARRMRAALAVLWPLSPTLFESAPEDDALASDGSLPDPRSLQQAWLERVAPFLEHCGLVPSTDFVSHGSRTRHGEHLDQLLRDLQAVASLDRSVPW